ncbi:peroxiredoxin-like family protein [Sediminitomix flava]|uniref:thioredoxin-dependent peroxiredoxin n=1 Tax=Sediminitomix flava TaxID=379075 RepID=A0A315Z7Z8_SEDFL|nr:peroxiredoxin-like family protein [Sediminitomix flava]PWJ39166.1 peroxiredoxin [Sediminitomix flava]
MATLNERLEQLKERLEGSMPPEALKIMHGATDDLRASGIMEKVAKVDDTFPSFTLVNQDNAEVSLADLLAKGPVVVTFYRGVWCPYCNADLANLKKYAEEIESLGASVIAISPEKPEFLKDIIAKQRLNYDILHDANNELAAELGLKFHLQEDLKVLYRDAFKIDLAGHQGNDEWALPMPARFLIDKDGKIRFVETDPDYRIRPEVEPLIEVLKSI